MNTPWAELLTQPLSPVPGQPENKGTEADARTAPRTTTFNRAVSGGLASIVRLSSIARTVPHKISRDWAVEQSGKKAIEPVAKSAAGGVAARPRSKAAVL